MLTDEAFERLSLSLGWSREACALARKIRNSDPVRLVRGGRGNVRGRYPSRKMGLTIQFESHTCELPWILDMEYHREDVLEYWDQPTSFKLEYRNRNDRRVSPVHTPDFFVIRKTHAEFVECKTEEDLAKLSNSQPGRYVLGKDGQWRCPPGETYAEQFGFKYRVVSSAEIDRTHYRNTLFLEDYLDRDTPPVAAHLREKIISVVSGEPGIMLGELLERSMELSAVADDVYKLIASGAVYVDLRSEPLAERDRAFVFPDEDSALKSSSETLRVREPKGKYVEVKENARVLFNNSVQTIVFIGESKIYLYGEDGATPCLSFSHFERLVLKGEIQGLDSRPDDDPDSRWKETLNNASEKRKKEAMRRLKAVECYLNREPLPFPVKPRTLARWKARFLTGQRMHGSGLAGLLPDWDSRGDRKTERLSKAARQIMDDAVENDYETIVQKSKFAVWVDVVRKCKELRIGHPSYVTFVKRVKKCPQHLQTLKRMGHRAAYATKRFFYWLAADTPRHGDRPFEICHIDHTVLDIELVDPSDGEVLGRPWATFLIDANSRRILALFLTFDPPSYRSNMMVLRECVRRTGRLPQTLVVDGGKDFQSVYFETLAAAFEITIKTRPPAQPRFGSVVERLFRTANQQFIDNLLGNTKITKNVRQVVKSNNPKGLAVWSLGAFYEALCDWAYERYDTETHGTLKQSPRDAYHSSIRLTGLRSHRLIRYDEEFRIFTCPSTRKGTAKNVVGRGVKINKSYHWCDELGEAEVESVSLPVRYDPYKPGVGYVYIRNSWIKCLSNDYFRTEWRTEREQQIYVTVERQKELNYSRALPERAVKRATENQEDEKKQRELSESLRLLRKRQAENETVLEAINGGRSERGNRASESPQVEGADAHACEGTQGKPSLFADVNFDQLGTLEAYEN